uniref:Uncharacterized protein n=1 Tax=Kalanchoe fedtschenkoi TaxID=63787 RepID=A0A7N1A7E2_KALFE
MCLGFLAAVMAATMTAGFLVWISKKPKMRIEEDGTEETRKLLRSVQHAHMNCLISNSVS